MAPRDSPAEKDTARVSQSECLLFRSGAWPKHLDRGEKAIAAFLLPHFRLGILVGARFGDHQHEHPQ